MKVSIISPEAILYEGDADSIVVPAYDGEVGILPRHAPFMTTLGTGVLRLSSGVKQSTFTVSGGFLQVADDHVRVVTESAAVA